MHLIPRSLAEWLKPLFEQFVAYGTRATLHENAARFAADALKAEAELGAEAFRALDQLDAARAGGPDANPHRARVAELLAAGIADTLGVYREVASSQLSPEQGKVALTASPTSGGSGPAELAPGAPSQALGQETPSAGPGTPAAPVKRLRGRPRKHPILPAPDRDGQP